MKISQGLFDRMVLQRDRNNLCAARFAGACAGAGRIMARVMRRGKVVKGFARVPVGRAARGAMRGRLRGLPAGGPFEIELWLEDSAGRATEALKIRDVLVGDVWILGGQSNMQGVGRLAEAAKPEKRVRAFYMDDRWAVARDPVHDLSLAIDRVHTDLNGGQRPGRSPTHGTGPGVAFGQAMARLTGVPQGLLACAHGGTSMQQWSPAARKLGGRSLYGAMLRRFHKNGGRVAGVVWYQGCSDATPEAAPLYTRRMKALVKAMRRDLGDARLPFAAVQIAGVFVPWDRACWNSIQDQQRRLPEAIARCVVAPAIDLDYADLIHLSGPAQARLGRRLAQAMGALRGDPGAGRLPIALRSATIVGSQIKVVFANVMGKLRAAGKPAGFTLAESKSGNAIYRVDLRGHTAWLSLTAPPAAQAVADRLHYGFGLAPHCNITDAADRSLPVFGPVFLGQPMKTSENVTRWLVSRALPSAGILRGLAYPRNRKALGFAAREFPGGLADLHLDLFRCAPGDRLVYFAVGLDCPERMKLIAGLGYDGPVKVWIDRRLRFYDPRGTNPANADKARIPFSAAAGRHEILIALGSNHGKAWGVCLRFMRRAASERAWARTALPKLIG